MYVFLKFGPSPDDVKVISNVTIGEDCVPVVNGESINQDSARDDDEASGSSKRSSVNNNTASGGGNIDAICWFKALPMQAVYIDCSVRDARWCAKSVTIRDTRRQESVRIRRNQAHNHHPDSDTQSDMVTVTVTDEDEFSSSSSLSSFMPPSSRPLFMDQPSLIPFNPVIDEMFERVEKLCQQWDTLMHNKHINREVARILHCYVFPAVTFHKQDVDVLQQCLRLVVVKHETLDRELLAKEKNTELTERFLQRLKEVILSREDLTSQSYLQACDPAFVDTLYVQVTKDIQNSNISLDIKQSRVNDLKKVSQGQGASEAQSQQLAQVTRERDDLYAAIQRLVMIREAIRNHLYRPFVPKKKSKKRRVKIDDKDASLHTNFRMVYQQLVEEKDLMKGLCYRKLHFSSMREALESTIKMLQREHPTSLGDFTEFSIISSNNSSSGSSSSRAGTNSGCEDDAKKCWKSMQGRVDGWMEREGTLRQCHDKGCQLVRDLVEGMLGDSRISLMGLDPNTPPGGSSGGEDLSSYRAPMVCVVRDQALAHLWDMAERIALRMKLDASPESRHLNRAWMCYEPHFWGQAGEAVVSVYTHYHGPHAREVHRRASSAAVADIMDSHFFHTLFSSSSFSADDDGEGEAGGTKAKSASASSQNRQSSMVGRLHSQDSVLALSLDLQRCSISDLYALANRDGAKVQCHMAELGDFMYGESGGAGVEGCCLHSAENGSAESDSSVESGIVVVEGRREGGEDESVSKVSRDGRGENVSAPARAAEEATPLCGNQTKCSVPTIIVSHDDEAKRDKVTTTAAADAAAGKEEAESLTPPSSSLRSSQTVCSVLGVFDTVIEPYHQMVREVLTAPSLMDKMAAVWRSVDFLSKRTQRVCQDQGMDSLLPMSIFATASFPEDLFVDYFLQLLILLDFKPEFTLHSIYDFSLSQTISTFMYLFDKRFTPAL